MITLFLGKPGQCKSLDMTAVVLDDYKRGLDVMTNYGLFFPKIRASGKIMPVNVEMLSDPNQELDNLTLALDEIQTVIDSRRSSSKKNIDRSHLFQQSRKRDMNIRGSCMNFGLVDPRLRQITDLNMLCQKVDRNFMRTLDPLWCDPEGFSLCWPYYPDTMQKASSRPLIIGPIKYFFKLYNTKERQVI